MEKYAEVSLDQKQAILEEYQPWVRGKGFYALAKRHNINGGPTTIRKWYKKWDGTKNSLEKESGGDRRSILTENEKKKEIVGYITKKSRKDAVNYPQVKKNVDLKTGKDIKLRTVQEIGKNLQMTSKKTKRKTPSEGTFHCHFSLKSFLGLPNYPQLVAKFRRKCQNIRKGRLVFIDGTGMRAEPRNLRGLAPKGRLAVTKASKPEKYEPRVDMYGAIAYTGPLACETVTSTQRKDIVNTRRKKKGVKGYTKSMLKKFLKEKLAPKIKRMKEKDVIIGLDKGLHMKKEEVLQELKDGGAKNILDAWIFPTSTAKYVNPLDNTLWHSLKERVRARKPESEDATATAMEEEFMGIDKGYYRHCALTRRSDAFKDL